jgi:Holliday junction resolvase RusA-like endonuclease
VTQPYRSKTHVPSSSEGEQRFVLPWPPSSNNLFLNVRGRGRVLTKEYREWREEAGWTLAAQRARKLTQPVTVAVELNPPSKHAFDLDNRAKALMDLLVLHGVIPDDSIKFVHGVSVRLVDTGAPCTITVRPVN